MKRDEDRAASRLIARLQKKEDRSLSKRRRSLTSSLKRALPHLTDQEFSAIEPVLWTAIGRSIARR